MHRRRCSTVAIGLSLVVCLAACTHVIVISAPATLSLGETATFVIEVSSGSEGTDLDLYVVAEVPAGWPLVSNSYSGTAGGTPVSGVGTVVPEPFPDCVPGPRAGYQRVWITDGPFTTTPSDSAEVTLEFTADPLPDGEFQLRFWLVTSDPQYSGCDSVPGVAAINREPHLFGFVTELFQVHGALLRNFDFASSQEGDFLYVGGFSPGGAEMTVFDRAPETGALGFLESVDEPSISQYVALARSPDDLNLYGVSTADTLYVLSRDPLTGTVALEQVLVDGVGGVNGIDGAIEVAVSPDGDTVYVASVGDNAVAALSRDPLTGQLSFVGAEFDSGWLVSLLGQSEMAVSSDGMNVYATGLQGVLVFDRAPATGQLAFQEAIAPGIEWLYSGTGISLSPDDSYLYAAGYQSNSIAVFSRNPATGALTHVDTVFDSEDNVVGLIHPEFLAISPDGLHLAAAGGRSLAVFQRDESTGDLTFVQADFEDSDEIANLGYPHGVAFSHDGWDLYHGGNTIAVFSRRTVFTDGFESGDTSAWSSTVP